MTLRCRQCGARFRPPPPVPGSDPCCPACGAPVPAPDPAGEGGRWRHPAGEPMSRVLTFVVGAALVLALLSPFLLSWFSGREDAKPQLLELEGPAPRAPGAPAPGPVSPLAPGERRAGPVPHSQFRGVRLDMTREELAQRYNLQLRNTRGMMPEIYEAADEHGVQLLVAHFYQNELKEFHLVMAARETVPPTLVAELRAQFGDPVEWSDADQPVPGNGLAQPRGAWSRLLADYRWQRQLVWADGENRLEATIYSTATDPQVCVSMLAVHVLAARWLAENQPRLPGAPSGTGPAAPADRLPAYELEPDTNPPIELPKFGLGK